MLYTCYKRRWILYCLISVVTGFFSWNNSLGNKSTLVFINSALRGWIITLIISKIPSSGKTCIEDRNGPFWPSNFSLHFCHPSSITLWDNPVGYALSCQLKDVALLLCITIFNVLINKDVMSFELSRRMATGLKVPFRAFAELFIKAIDKIVFLIHTVWFQP